MAQKCGQSIERHCLLSSGVSGICGHGDGARPSIFCRRFLSGTVRDKRFVRISFEFAPSYRDFAGRTDSKADVITAHGQHRYLDRLCDDYLLFAFSIEDQHGDFHSLCIDGNALRRIPRLLRADR